MAAKAPGPCGADAANRFDSSRSRHVSANTSFQIVGSRLTEPNPSTMQSNARETAERLVAHGLPAQPTPEAAAAGAEEVIAHLYRNLSQWVGSAGCQALFSRALVLCTVAHPVCEGVRYRPQGPFPHLERLAANAQSCGGDATVAGITAVVSSIVSMLTGLIGDEDIVKSLLENGPHSHQSGAPPVAPNPAQFPPRSANGSDNGRAPTTNREDARNRRRND